MTAARRLGSLLLLTRPCEVVALHQQQQQQGLHQQPSPSPYSTAAFSQSIQSPVNPQFASNRQTASPSSVGNHQSPYANPLMNRQSPQQVPSNSQQPGMAQPPSQPQQAQPIQQQVQTPIKTQPPPPLSPVAQARLREQVDMLLQINSLLLEEVQKCYDQGKGGPIAPIPPAQDARPEHLKQQVPSKEYTE